MSAPLLIWLFNPYHTGSHRAWAEGYAAHSRHEVHIVSMAGYFWKWRLQGGAIELSEQAGHLLAQGRQPDLLLCTSMVNIPALLALRRRELSVTPVVLYMHENQLTYPQPPGTKRDLTYGMIQHQSMLAADRVYFNSAYHMESWFDELPRLLKHFPDYVHLESATATRAKAAVLPVGCELKRYDRFEESVRHTGPPLVLWNQRWEYDKDPESMLQALYELADEGLEFRVALAGENFRVEPAEFAEARSKLGPRLVHYGFADDETYGRLLWESDIVLSTAIHEFFGVSIVEAMYCGCMPVLPRRLSYPELIPAALHEMCLYTGRQGLLERMRAAIRRPRQIPELRAAMAHYDWTVQAPVYDRLMAEVAAQACTS